MELNTGIGCRQNVRREALPAAQFAVAECLDALPGWLDPLKEAHMPEMRRTELAVKAVSVINIDDIA